MGVIVAVIFIIGFVAFLVFVPMKAETAEKIVKDFSIASGQDNHQKLFNSFGDDALASYNETRTNPAYSYLSDNIHHKD